MAVGCHYRGPNHPRNDNKIKALGDPRVLSNCIEENTIIQVGLAYRMMKPDEDNSETLETLLLGKEKVKNIQQLLEDKVQQDFINDQLVQVSGWILSITEARQCALYSLYQKN
jgi:hypothetical protein